MPEIALPIYATALTSIMVQPLVAPEDFEGLLADRRISDFLIGPGAGTGAETGARVTARRTGAVVVLKGSDTVIAAPDGGRSSTPTLRRRSPPRGRVTY